MIPKASDRIESNPDYGPSSRSEASGQQSRSVSSFGEGSSVPLPMSNSNNNQRYQHMDIKISLLALDGVTEETKSAKDKNRLKAASCGPKGGTGVLQSPGLPPTHYSANDSNASIDTSTCTSSEASSYNKIPITAVATFVSNAPNSTKLMSTNLPSLPLNTPVSAIKNINRHVVSWPADFDPTGSELSTFKFERHMKEELLSIGKMPGEENQSVMSIFVPEKFEIHLGLLRGSEMIKVGAATLVVTGEELMDTQVNLPVKISREAVKRDRNSRSKMFRKSSSNHKNLKAIPFPSAPSRKYRLDESATLRLLVKVSPRENSACDISESLSVASSVGRASDYIQICSVMNSTHISTANSHARSQQPNTGENMTTPMRYSAHDIIIENESRNNSHHSFSENNPARANDFRLKPPPLNTTSSYQGAHLKDRRKGIPEYKNSNESFKTNSNNTKTAYSFRESKSLSDSSISDNDYYERGNRNDSRTHNHQRRSKQDNDLRDKPSYDSLLDSLEASDIENEDNYTFAESYADTHGHSLKESFTDHTATYAEQRTSCNWWGGNQNSNRHDGVSSCSESSDDEQMKSKTNVREARRMIHKYAHRMGVDPNELI